MALKDSGGSALGSSRGTGAARSAANVGGFTPSGGNYMKGTSRTIPSETPSGQLGMFPAGAYKTPMLRGSNMRGTAFSMKPPFKPTGTGRPASGSSARLARNAELVAKRKAKTTYGPMTATQYIDFLFKG